MSNAHNCSTKSDDLELEKISERPPYTVHNLRKDSNDANDVEQLKNALIQNSTNILTLSGITSDASSVNTVNNVLTVKDITSDYFTACKLALDPGELLHEKWFTLQHAMSAIEIMDMKMDAHMECNRRVITTIEALHDGQLMLGPFIDVAELIGIMDELLSTFVNWLSGDSLAQSVFICMYMHCTPLIKDSYLSAFCEVLRRIVHQLRSLIMAVSVYDEEDFYTSANQMPIQYVNNEYSKFDTEFDLTLNKMNTTDLLNHIENLAKSVLNDACFVQSDKDLRPFLQIRLNFLSALLQFSNALFMSIDHTVVDLPQEVMDDYSVVYSSADPNANTTNVNTTNVDYRTTNLWSKLVVRCQTLSVYLTHLQTLSQLLIDSADAGKPAGFGKSKPNDLPYGQSGFEVFLNRSILPSYMPKVVLIYDRLDAFHHYLDLFTRLSQINRTFQVFGTWHQMYTNSVKLNWLWSFIQKFGQQMSFYQFCLKKKNETIRRACVLSRTITYMLYFEALHYKDFLDFKPTTLSVTHLECFFSLWLQLVPCDYREQIREIIFRNSKLLDFFSSLSLHLIQIPGMYCTNRSRQRSALLNWLRKTPNLLVECGQSELMIEVELRATFYPNTSCSTNSAHNGANQSDIRILLCLMSYISYIYYYLTWDYIVTGFQLDLYSSYEYTYMYIFMNRLLQNVSGLLRTLSDKNELNFTKHVDSSTVNKTANEKVSKNTKSAKRKNRKCKKKGDSLTNSTKVENSEVSILSMVDEICLSHEEFFINIHINLCIATLYTIRALEVDSGYDDSFTVGEVQLRSYAHRLGDFIAHPYSPLADYDGIVESYKSCKLYAAKLVAGRPTSELYGTASATFKQVECLIRLAENSLSAGKQAVSCSLSKRDMPFSILLTNHLGPHDDLSQLQQLAKHNSVACRLLATCPDRRPPRRQPDRTMDDGCDCKQAAICFDPVKLDFDFIESRTYPLIRLMTTVKH